MVGRFSSSMRGEDGSALRMAEHDDEPRAVALRRKLDAADLRRRDDIAGDADDEQIAEPLVEHDFRRHARVGAAEDDGERLLAGSDLRAARFARQRIVAADVGNEATVAVSKALKCFGRRNHRGVIVVRLTALEISPARR